MIDVHTPRKITQSQRERKGGIVREDETVREENERRRKDEERERERERVGTVCSQTETCPFRS